LAVTPIVSVSRFLQCSQLIGMLFRAICGSVFACIAAERASHETEMAVQASHFLQKMFGGKREAGSMAVTPPNRIVFQHTLHAPAPRNRPARREYRASASADRKIVQAE